MTNDDYVEYLFDVLNSGIDFLEDLILKEEYSDKKQRYLDFAREHMIRATTALQTVKYSKD